jgi:hypothetical protein
MHVSSGAVQPATPGLRARRHDRLTIFLHIVVQKMHDVPTHGGSAVNHGAYYGLEQSFADDRTLWQTDAAHQTRKTLIRSEALEHWFHFQFPNKRGPRRDF